MFHVAVAQSEDIDADEALREVLLACETQLGQAPPKAALIFASIELDHPTLLRELRARYPGIAVIGCTTDGEFASPGGFSESSLVLTLFASDTVEIIAGVARGLTEDPLNRSRDAIAAAAARSEGPIVCCITTPESLTTRAEAVLAGLRDGLPQGTTIVGACAGDQVRFTRTYQFFGDEVLSDAAPFLLFSGDLRLAHGVASGWRPLGRRVRVDRVRDNIVETLDGEPALAYFQRYLGAGAIPNGEHALAVFEADQHAFYLRAPMTADPLTGSVTLLGEIPLGALVQLTQTSPEEIIAGSTAAIAAAVDSYPGEAPAVALCFSCAGRRHLLGRRAGEELAAVLAKVPKGLAIAGFYGYAELGPTAPGRPSRLHNETFVALVLGTG